MPISNKKGADNYNTVYTTVQILSFTIVYTLHLILHYTLIQ